MVALNTPFLWLEADDHDEPHRAGRPLTICDTYDNDVAEIYSREDATVSTTREQAIAIARLFAAAPDLVAALKLAERHLPKRYVLVRAEIKATLAKALSPLPSTTTADRSRALDEHFYGYGRP